MIGLPFGLLSKIDPLAISYSGSSAFSGTTLGGPALGIMEIDADGTIDQAGDQIIADKASWAQNTNPPFDAADYDFRMDVVTGSLGWAGSSATGVWIPGATAGIQAAWGEEVAGAVLGTFTGTFRVRPAGGGADLITQAVSIIADGTP